MAVLKGCIPFFREIFAIPGLLAEGPVLVFGHQDTIGKDMPADFSGPDLRRILERHGARDITTADFFDARADWRHDFNTPVPQDRHGRYHAVIDIGCIEHVFDTAQCLKNCMAMVREGGFYVLETQVGGCTYHGWHTFHPDLFPRAFALNGFDVVYLRYSSFLGAPVRHSEDAPNASVWIVGRKRRTVPFTAPQQEYWREWQAAPSWEHGHPKLAHFVSRLVPPALVPLARRMRRLVTGR